jgi:DNA-binding transcriptional LysR family regulator
MVDDRLERFARNLDWNLLRTFVVVVQEGSITAAANRLLLQQPAVSMALKRLEETVGHRLIERRPGYFEMTEAGRKVYLQAREIFGAVVRLPDLTADAGVEISGHISIHTISHAHNPHWDAMLAAFFRDHPLASVSCTVDTTANVIRAVERKVATLGLSDGVIPEALSQTLFARERHALYCGRGHRLYGASDLRFDDLRGEPFVSFTADVLGGQHMGPVTAVRAYASFGQWVRAASCNVEEVQRMICAGIGIGMLPVHLAREPVAQQELWQLPPYDHLPITETFQITNPGSPLNAAETAFLERCRAVPAFEYL